MVCGKTMIHAAKSGGDSPRVIIFSESGPLAGDLGACLSGCFSVERVTSLAGARNALERPTAALLMVPARRDRVGIECIPLFRQAVACGCRVILLGGLPPGLDEELQEQVVAMPQFPSPSVLFAGLSDLQVVGPSGPPKPVLGPKRVDASDLP